MELKKIFILSALLLTAKGWAVDVPTKSPSCQKDLRIRSVKNGAGVVFNENCSVAFVLPPISGQIEISRPTLPPRADRCFGFNMASDDLKRIRKSMDQLLDQIARLKRGSGLGGGSLGGGTNVSPKVKEKIAELEAEYKQLGETLRHFSREQQRLADEMKSYEGSHIAVNYTWNYDELIGQYQKKNPHIRFARLPISKATMSFHRNLYADVDSYPALLYMDVAGITDLDFQQIGYEPPGGLVDAQYVSPTSQHRNLFGESVGGKLILSLPASCHLYDDAQNKMKTDIKTKDLRGFFSATVDYTYNLQAFRKYKARFQLANFVKRIAESKTKNGFLSSQTINSLIEERDSSDWFELEVESDHPGLTYEDIAKEVKADLIQRVLNQITYATTGQSIEAPAQITPPRNGADQTADNLMKSCQHPYCLAGGVFLKFLSSSFGSSAAVSKFISNNNFWAGDNVTDKKMFEYAGTSSFEIE